MTNTNWRVKMAILSISILTLMAGAAVAPGLGEISRVFAGYSPTTVKLVISLPPLLIIPFALLSGYLSSLIGKKRLLIAGLAIYMAGGAGAAFVDSLPLLLAFRAVLGMGTGIILPLSTSLIADLYQGEQRARMLGFSSAFNCLGTILANILAGILVGMDWHYIFYVYFLAVPVLLLAVPFIPLENPMARAASSQVAVPKELACWSLAAFLAMTAFFGLVTNLSLLIENRNIGSSEFTGLMFALNSLCMLFAGAFFQIARRRLGQWYGPCVLFLMAAGYAVMMTANTVFPIIAAIILSGLGTGLVFPFVMNRASLCAREDNSVVIMGIVSSCAFLGQFLSPLILDGIPDIAGDSLSNVFMVLALGTGLLFVASLSGRLFASRPMQIILAAAGSNQASGGLPAEHRFRSDGDHNPHRSPGEGPD